MSEVQDYVQEGTLLILPHRHTRSHPCCPNSDAERALGFGSYGVYTKIHSSKLGSPSIEIVETLSLETMLDPYSGCDVCLVCFPRGRPFPSLLSLVFSGALDAEALS